MKKILVVDFNGTSPVYTHYFTKGITNENTFVAILGKKKSQFLDIFKKVSLYINNGVGIKPVDYFINWGWLLLNANKFDVVIIQWLMLVRFSSIEIFLIGYLQKRVKVIYVAHNITPHNNKSKKVANRFKRLYKKLKYIGVHTEEVKKAVSSIAPNSIILNFKHGLFFNENAKHRPSRTFNNTCLIIGFISKYKGIEDAILVMEKLSKKKVDVTLKIKGYGNKSYVNELNNLIHQKGLSSKIHIESRVLSTREIIREIKDSCMLWLPYKAISQSGVSYTSLGLKTPFVAYDVGNFKLLEKEFQGSIVVDPGRIDLFSQAVEKVLLNNVALRKKICMNSAGLGWAYNWGELNIKLVDF